MEIAQQRVVYIHYTLTNDAGEVLDSSRGNEPLAYLHGAGNIIAGLESALAGKQAGDKLNVRVEPSQGYGERDERLVQDVPRRAFEGIAEIQPGMSFQAQSNQGPMRVVVTRVAGDMVTVDGNHPLAGEALNFDVEVTEVRDASQEELSHGHVHGPGGHHH
ncbi:MAG: FKBP-type peptidyl-prolyl cis-trans isomerase [Sinimarinibacterium flocculans]|uniref:Peptidyl-prolyl cis-trans isomerase n=1 Tax=Sinimarinibacterium flocculans TaxID=985250 RepID=A0A318E398_9GAMM|nr:peptidylprolyl isomerase [Sinimarinibacterium flocculans]MEC9364861.1 peptidylprolyl isomerase [Pseudomonadota bacterium]PXV64580.1 FKBP-type peptidyl prolyl cis-trans isomerase /apo-metallochaperone SlyD [Sinimarinibacterium flocculans]